MKKSFLILFVLIMSFFSLKAQNCNPPTGLKATLHTPEWRNVSLSWTPATDATQQVFGYGTTNSSSVNSGNDFTAVIRLTSTELATYGSRYLSAVQFKPGMSQSECEYTLFVWQGGSVDLTDTTVNPGTLVTNQFITQSLETGVLNTVFLDNPIAVDPTQELWIGIRANHPNYSGFPIGASYNTSVVYKGNVITNGNTWWLLNLSSQPNNTNWYMFAVFTEPSHIATYNVYRDNTLLTTTPAPSYIDSLEIDGEYVYSVNASYADNCTSASITKTVTMNNDCFIDELPYTENFDGITGTTATTLAGHVLPDCWGWINHGATYPGLPTVFSTSSYSSSTPNSLRFHTYNVTDNNTTYADQYAILPPIDVNIHPISTLQLEFDARCYSTTTTYQLFLEVGVMSSFSDPTTFEPIDTIHCTGTTYGNYTVNFSEYVGNGQYIAFRVPKLFNGGTVYNSGVVDNIVLDVIPTCPKPTDLAVNTALTTDQSITVTWVENGAANEWQVEYGPAGFVPGNGTTEIATSTSLTVYNLSASMPYDFYVRSVCSVGDTSYYSAKLSASTACGTLSSLPYTQNFEAYTGSTSGTTANIGQACWSQINTGTSSSYIGFPIIYNTTSYAQSGVNCLRFYTYITSGTYGDQYAIMPAVDVNTYPINTLQVEFAAAKYSTYSLNLIVGVMDDSASIASFIPVDTITIPTTATAYEYNTYLVSFENYTGNGTRIAFKVPQPSSSYNAGLVDDVILSTIPNCKKPMNVLTTGVTNNSVTVDWTPMGDETNWDVVVVPEGNTVETGNIEYASEHPFTVTNLTENTDYDVYVRANCSGEVSPWSNVFTFTTRCNPLTVMPFSEDFDSYPAATAAASGVIPTCWDRETNNTSSYPYIYSTQHASGTGSLYFYSTTAYYSKAISPMLDLSQYVAGQLSLSFKAIKTSSSYGNLNIYTATNPFDENTYTLLKSLTSSDYDGTYQWTDFGLVLQNQYTEPVCLVFEAPATATSYACIDDIVLEETPDCSSPRNVTVSDIHGANAKVNWKEAWFGADSYYVEYSEAGAENWSSPQLATGTSFFLTDLNPLTAYEVRVSSNCASGTADYAAANFSTLCLIPEEVSIGTGTSTSYYIPFYGAYQYSFSQQLYTASEMNNEPKDINTISFQYTGESAITRTVDIYLMNTLVSSLASEWAPMTDARLVFSGDITMNKDADDDGWNTIVLDSVFHYDGIGGLLIAVNNRSSVSAGTSATTRTFKYTSATGKGRYVTGGSTAVAPYNPYNMTVAGTSYAYHNNIKFGSCNTTSTCAVPTLFVDEVTDQSITLSWIPGYQENSWELEYKAQSDADWTNEGVVTSSPYTLQNLSINTQYEIRLRALCTDTSDWATEMAHTLCTSIDVPYTQDFESAPGSGAAYFVDCWTRGTDNTTNYPYTSTSTTYIHDGSFGVYFYTAANKYSYAATPIFNDGVRMDSLQIRFWAKKSSASYFIEVGVMSNPYDYSSFELLGRLFPDTISTWQELEITTQGYTGSGRCVAFRLPSTSSANGMYIDDIVIQYIPNCPRVQDVAAVNVQSHQADIVWNSSSDASSWYYMYGLKDSVVFDINNAELAYEDSISLTNLMANTEYDVFIMSACDNGEISEVVKYTFATLCDPISTLPYRESFDTYGGSGSAYYPNCWYRKYVSSTSTTVSYPYIYSTNFNTAPSSLYMYGLTSTPSYSVAIMQPFADNINLNTLQVDLSLRTATLTNYLLVGVMTDPDNVSTFTVVDTLYCTATSVFEPKTSSLASYTGTGKYIAFKCWGTMYMDDIVVDLIPACDNPTDMTFSNITLTSATIGWTAGDAETSWEVYVVPAGNSILDETPAIVNNNSYDATNLTVASEYDVYVRAICPTGQGHSGYLVSNFFTACEAISTLPITEDFDSYTGSTTGSVNNLPNCWNYLNNCTVASYAEYPIVYANSTYAQSGNNSIRFYTFSSSSYSDQYLVLPQLNTTVIPINTLAMEFDMRKYSTSYNSLLLEVGVMSDPAVDTTFVPVDTVEVFSTDYSRQIVYFNNYTGNGSFIAFRAPKPATSYNAGHIDNLVIDLMPSCLRVSDLEVSNVSNNSATISWTPSGNESAWIVNYKPESDTVWQTDNASTTTYQLLGLTANTTYDVMVVADCGGDQSVPSSIVSFTTDCEDLSTLPITENFDNYTGTTTGTSANIPTCWRQMNFGTTSSSYDGYPIMYNSTSYAFSGNNSLRYYTYTSGSTNYGDQWAVLRGIDTTVIPIQTLQLKMKARKYSASYQFNLIVGVMSDWNDTSTFVPVATVSPAGVDYEDMTVYFSNYSGGGKYIVLKVDAPATSYNAGYIDDLEISLAPTCLPVSNLTASSVTDNSISITWDVLGDETMWNVNYRPANDTSWIMDVAMNNPTYTLSNLQPNTTYYFRVQPDCGGETAPFTDIITVTTQCVALNTLPYSENFDSYTGSTYNTAGPVPDCWNTFTDNDARPAPHVIGSGSYYYPLSQPNALSFVGSSPNTNAIAVLPEFTAALNTLQLAFVYRMESTSYGTLKVGYITNIGDPVNSFVEVASLTSTTTITPDTVRFDNVSAAGRIAFVWNYVGSSFYSCNIDNVVVDAITAPATCDAPTNVNATNITDTSATISWTAGGAETAWNLQYKAASAADWSNSVNVTAPTYNLTGLTANTTYQVRVQAVCDADNTSDWSAMASFTTEEVVDNPCDAPTNVNATNVTETSATITWTPGGDETAWNLQYKLNTATDWGSSINVTSPTYDLTGLTANTTYQVRVQAVCDADNTSDWSAMASFTTEEEVVVEPCDAPSNLTAYEINGDNLTLTWQENGTATSWTIYYRVTGTSSWTTQVVNATTYVLTGLTPETQYDIQVVANCADGVTSDPSNTVNPTTTVGINDYVEANVTVAPNPTTGVVKVSSSKFQVSGVDVYDVYGKLLNTMTVNDGTVEVDLGQYAADVYFLRISTESGVVTKRVVKR